MAIYEPSIHSGWDKTTKLNKTNKKDVVKSNKKKKTKKKLFIHNEQP